MNKFQHTIGREITIEGVGLHSGRDIVMTLKPAGENDGISFTRVDVVPGVTIPVAPDRVNDTRMATTINEGPVFVSTIEHLMSAFSGLGVDNVKVCVNAPETPILDGSGLLYAKAILEAGLVEQNKARSYVRVKKTVEVKDGDKWARLTPSDSFQMDFAIDFHNPAIDKTKQRVQVDFAQENYMDTVAYARTFGFLSDLNKLRAMGLAQGGTLQNAVVVDGDTIVNPEGLRADDEFVKHKMLDAMGDLYVLGQPLLARYEAFKSGHAINNKLLRALLSDKSQFERVTL